MAMKHILLIAFTALFFINHAAQAQSTAAVARNIDAELMVDLQDEASISKLIRSANLQKPASVTYLRNVSLSRNIHLIQFDTEQWGKQELLRWLSSQPAVVAAQANHWIQFNNEPNDPDFSEQWGALRIGAPEVWDITTSGLTALGDTIVVAVVDSGFELDHEDLAPNLWNNNGEIPGDGQDNDNNGYIDDTWGWDFKTNSNQVSFDDHGLAVAGILGARGNNELGISGISWNIKLMLLTISTADDVVSSYDYVIEQRKRYNESNGAEGAFVVATNASFGVPQPVFCDEQPVWGSMYDAMGEVGVLTGAGTTNKDLNVDLEGDMPTTCESDFIITVLNGTEEDEKYVATGYGATSIDMAAPGQESYSLKPFNRYGSFGGNSAAAPHLSGAIALLYSMPCEQLAASAVTDPSGTALAVRNALLEGVDLMASFEGITATGGRLNVAGAVERINAACGGTGALDIVNIRPNPASSYLEVIYETPDFEKYQFRAYNALGQLVYRNEEQPGQFEQKLHRIDVSNWALGTYFVSIIREDEQITRPVVIMR